MTMTTHRRVASAQGVRQARGPHRTAGSTSVSGRLTAIDAQSLAGHEAGPFEVEDPFDYVLDLSDAAERVAVRHGSVGRGVALRCLDDSRATAFTRMPAAAYSIARDRVTPSTPPFVKEVSAEGVELRAWSTRLVVMFTTWPRRWTTNWRMTRCVM